MIAFERPELLYLFIILPFLVVLHFIALLTVKKRAFKFANYETLKRLGHTGRVFSKQIWILIIRLLLVSILILAMSGFSLEIKTKGFADEVVFALDSSGSMMANDVLPSRFEASKNAIKSVLDNSSFTSKIALLSFTSVVYVETPFTVDKLAFVESLEALKTRKTSGTSIGNALSFASVLFEPDSDKSKYIVILTDGQENHMVNREILDIVRYVTEKNIKIFIVGVGTSTGAPIQGDIEGNSVTNEDLIKYISDKNDGGYAIAESQEEITKSINDFFEKGDIIVTYNLSIWLFLAAMLLLVFEWYLTNYTFRKFP